MRYISMHKSDKKMEAGEPPSPEVIAGMGPLIGEMMQAGIFLGGEGLRPSALGVRVRYSDGRRTIVKGPFAGGNELIAAFSIVKVKSIEEAIEWSSRFATVAGNVELDIRPVTEPWDLGFFPKPAGETGTRFMVAQKADAASEAGAVRGRGTGDAGGVLLASESLQPSAKGVRLHFAKGKRTITDGPFTESKELIAGYSIMRAESIEGPIEWASRFAALVGDVEIDIRPLYD
jgi:hypothetical protein